MGDESQGFSFGGDELYVQSRLLSEEGALSNGLSLIADSLCWI